MSNVVLLLRSPCSPGFTMQQMLDSKGRNPKTPQMQESQSTHLSLSTQLETMNVDYYKKSGVGISLPYKLNRSIFEWNKTLPVKENTHKMLVFFCERSHSLRSEHEELIFVELCSHGACLIKGQVYWHAGLSSGRASPMQCFGSSMFIRVHVREQIE